MGTAQFKESISHGTKFFPFALYRLNRNRPLHLHWHDEMEIIQIESGEGLVSIGANLFKASPHDIFFVNSGELHSVKPIDSTTISFTSVVFNKSFLKSDELDIIQFKYITPLIENTIALPKKICSADLDSKETPSVFSLIIEEFTAKTFGYELSIKSLLYRLILLMLRMDQIKDNYSQAYSVEESANLLRIKRVLEYVEQNYAGAITVHEISALINVSDYYLCHLFKQMVGVTLIEYVNIVRVSKAEQILMHSDKKILEIALDNGFNSLSYFIKTFKKYRNYTPTEFRKIVRQPEGESVVPQE